jgi:hypothetical protein
LIGAGTIINPILKVVTTVAILGAVYLFFVKPVLDTTENITNDVSRQTQQAFKDADEASEEFDLNFAHDRAESFANSLRTQWPEAAREVTICVRAADKDAKAMEKCDELGQELVSQGQSPRNFSLSYADSLAAQGKTAEAAQVEKCVEDADFNVRALERCRDLADRLLFP